MTHNKYQVGVRLATLFLTFLTGFATPATKAAAPDASQLWLTVEEVELAITARVRLVISVDGVPGISYPAGQDWSDGRASERFPLPAGRSLYTFQFEATLSDGTRTIVASASEPFTLDSSKLPVTRQYVRLYPKDSRTWGRGAIARLVLSVGPGTQSQESPPSPKITVEEVVNRLETQRDSHELGLGETVPAWPTMDPDVAGAKSALAKRLEVRPQDVQGLLLWARAGFRADLLPTPEAALDRVLAVEPRNAEALYYKGRLYGRFVKAGGTLKKRMDVSQAVSFLRQAVEYAPENVRYRRTLALFLADQGLPGEAKSILTAVRRNDPMVKLLEELEAVPIPEGSEYLLDHPLWGAAMLEFVASNTIEDYLHLRLRFYRIPKSSVEIQAYYATRIPDFRFFDEKGNPLKAERAAEGDYVQFVHMKSGTVRPSRNLQEIPDPKRRQPGILMMLYEMRNDPELGRQLGPGESNCYLLLVNTRK